MITLRNVWEASNEAERDMPLMVGSGFMGKGVTISEPVRSTTIIKDYVDGNQTHPAVLVLSDLRPEEVK